MQVQEAIKTRLSIRRYADTMIPDKDMKVLLNVPNEKKIVICMTLGKPKGKHVPKSRKTIESFVYLNHFGRSWNNIDRNCL